MYTNILTGPSKLDLLTSLAYSQNISQRHYVIFTTQETSNSIKIRQQVNIVAMKVDDESGESWALEGYIKRRNGFSRKVTINYRTDTRVGFIEDAR